MESAVLTWEKKQSEYEQTLRGYLDTAVEIKDGLHARAVRCSVVLAVVYWFFPQSLRGSLAPTPLPTCLLRQ